MCVMREQVSGGRADAKVLRQTDLSARESRGNAEQAVLGSPLTFEWTPSDCHVNNRLYVGKHPRKAAPVEAQVRDRGLGLA